MILCICGERQAVGAGVAGVVSLLLVVNSSFGSNRETSQLSSQQNRSTIAVRIGQAHRWNRIPRDSLSKGVAIVGFVEFVAIVGFVENSSEPLCS